MKVELRTFIEVKPGRSIARALRVAAAKFRLGDYDDDQTFIATTHTTQNAAKVQEHLMPIEKALNK